MAHQIAPRVEICFASANELYDQFRIHVDYANPAVHSEQANINIVTHPVKFMCWNLIKTLTNVNILAYMQQFSVFVKKIKVSKLKNTC